MADPAVPQTALVALASEATEADDFGLAAETMGFLYHRRAYGREWSQTRPTQADDFDLAHGRWLSASGMQF